MSCEVLLASERRALVRLHMGAKARAGMYRSHRRDVPAQCVTVDDDGRGGKLRDVHCAGGGTRTPNTQDLNLLPLPIGLRRREPQCIAGADRLRR